MTTLKVKKFPSIDELNAFMSGILSGGSALNDKGRLQGGLFLHGKTLIFSAPVATVTFTATPAGTQVPITVADVLAQIAAGAAGVTAGLTSTGRLTLKLTAGGTITLAGNGTANAELGFGNVAASGIPLTAPGGATPTFVAIDSEGASNSYTLVYNDT
jgi:hypothetical protein